MAAWGVRNFENDTAEDFLDTLLEEGPSLVKYAIQKVAGMRRDDYLDCLDAEECLAAAELIAASKGKPSEDLPEDMANWIEKNNLLKEEDVNVQRMLHTQKSIIDVCLDAIYRVRNASELKEEWQGTSDYEAWLAVVDDLRSRLQG